MTFTEARWGLLLMFSEGLGRRLLGVETEEDDAMRKARSALGG